MPSTAQPKDYWLLNGKLNGELSPFDRGLSYGDGVFTTMAWRHGVIEFLAAHLQRISHDAAQLHMQVDTRKIEQELADFLHHLQDDNIHEGVIKIIISRGISRSGYKASAQASISRMILFQALPQHLADWQKQGIHLTICKQRLSSRFSSGAKHLNRLEQVLARAEWSDEAIQEGLMLSAEEQVIETTAANIFWRTEQTLYTPKLTNYGVKGVMRAQVLEYLRQQPLEIQISDLSLDQLLVADEVFITNSLLTICPVISLNGAVAPDTTQLEQQATSKALTRQQKSWSIGELSDRLQSVFLH